MSLVADLTFHEPILFTPTFDRVPGVRATFADVHTVSTDSGDRGYVFFWWVRAPDFDAFEAALAADPTAADSRVVSGAGERRLYRVTSRTFPPDQPLVYPLCREYDVTTIEFRLDADGLHLRARAPDRRALSALVDVGEAVARDVTVTSLATEATTRDDRLLTAKQHRALSLALDRGYFETPSRSTLAELATETDVTPQTLSRHIRVGVRKVVGAAVAPITVD